MSGAGPMISRGWISLPLVFRVFFSFSGGHRRTARAGTTTSKLLISGPAH